MNKFLISVIALASVGIISAFALSPYLTESTIDEALPVGAIITPTMKDKMMNEEMTDEEMMMDNDMMMNEEMMMDNDMMKDEMMMDNDMMMNEDMMEKEMMMNEEMTDEEMMMEKEMMEKEMMEKEMMEKEFIPMSYAGTFIGVGDGIHDARGDAFTVPLEDGSNVLRLENFRSTNGPDLYVYLSTDSHASEFVSLGELKANNGNQNYEIPNDTDLDKYDNVLIWCKAFGVLFGSAELSSN